MKSLIAVVILSTSVLSFGAKASYDADMQRAIKWSVVYTKCMKEPLSKEDECKARADLISDETKRKAHAAKLIAEAKLRK